MTEEVYKERLIIIEQDYKSELRKLYSQYAGESRIYKIGDIIKSEQTGEIILIDSFGTYKSFDFPIPVYQGVLLRKDLTPRKDNTRSQIFGNVETKKLI